jgi:hypothetical protein
VSKCVLLGVDSGIYCTNVNLDCSVQYYFRYGTQEAAPMAWPVERPFYPEEVRQPDVGSSGVGGTSEEEPDN